MVSEAPGKPGAYVYRELRYAILQRARQAASFKVVV
jgi:hypothetical protein